MHCYYTEGNFTVTLTVIDDNGSNDTYSQEIEIDDKIPFDMNGVGRLNAADVCYLAKRSKFNTPGSADTAF